MHYVHRCRSYCLMLVVILVCGVLALPIPAVAKSGSKVTSSGTNKPFATTTPTTAKGTNKIKARPYCPKDVCPKKPSNLSF